MASPRSLSLALALELAHQASPSATAAQARVEAAQARLKAATATPNPSLTLAVPFGSRATGGFDEGILASQTIELGKRGARAAVARAALASAQSQGVGAGFDLDLEVSRAYFEAKRSQTDLELAQNALQVAQQFDTAAQIQLQAGDAPRQNTVRSSIELLRAQQALRSAQNDADNALSTLKSLVGLDLATPIQLSDELAFVPQTFIADDLQRLALTTRADVRSAQAELASRRAAISSAKAARKPDAFIEARRASIFPSNNQDNGNSLRVGLTIQPFDWGSTKAGIREAQANEREGEALLAETQRLAILDFTTTLANFNNAQNAVQSFDNARLAKSKELLEMAQIGYERGASSYLELLDAQTTYRTEQADYARALADYNVDLANLKRAVGGSFNPTPPTDSTLSTATMPVTQAPSPVSATSVPASPQAP